MSNTRSLVKRIKERKSVINLDINSRIKYLQKQLVTLSFQNGNQTEKYFSTLQKIENLRKELFIK